MQIETKFEVGQTVYTIINGVEQVKIKKIKICIKKQIVIIYEVEAGKWVLNLSENQVFATQEEAEKALEALDGSNKSK